MKTYGAIIIAAISMALIFVVSQSIQVHSSIPTSDPDMSVDDAVEIGRKFLDSHGYTTGWVLSTFLEVREPNFFWHDVFGLVRPGSAEAGLFWVIRYEQASRPGHYFEVWVAEGGSVLGGS